MSIQKERLYVQFDEALHAADPFGRLREVVRGLLVAGHERAVLYNELQCYVVDELRPDGRDEDEDVVLDVMDCLVGWCGPDMRL
jgi:hypothetical protein